MLHFIYQREQADKPILDAVSGTFTAYYERDWLEDPIVIDILKDIDHITIDRGVLVSDLFGPATPDQISNGAKNLILIHRCEDLREQCFFNEAKMGENCIPWLMKLGSMYDVYVYYAYSVKFGDRELAANPIHNLVTDEYYYSDDEVFKGYIYCT